MKKSTKKYLKIALAMSVSLSAAAYFTRDTPQQKEAKYIRRGDDLFAKGDYKKARLEYKNAAKISPVDPDVAYRWGLVDEAEGDIRNAFIDFSQAEQQNPHYRLALLKLAHYQLAAGNLDEVQKRIDAVLADLPEDPEARAMQAALYLRKPDFAATEKEARFALSKDPANITAFSVLTGSYMAQNKLDKAGEIVDQGIAQNPKDLSLMMLRVRLYETPLNLPKLKEACEAIFKLEPNDPQYRVYLADTYVSVKKPDDAEATLREGVATMPDNWGMKKQLVIFLSKNRNMEVAEKEIKGYMQQYPDKSELYFWLSDLYLSHDNVDKAVALLQQVISSNESNKQSLNAQTSLAHINFAKGNKEVAEKLIAAVLDKAPNNHQALYIRANIAADRGQYQQAVSDLRLIIRDDPQAKDALQLLSEVLLLQGYTDLAIDTQNQLMDIDPANSAIRVRLAQMYNVNGDPQRAMALLAIVTKNDPKYPVGWENTARVAIDMKDFTTAKAAIQTLDTLEGQHLTAAFLEGQISQTSGKNEEAQSSYTKVIDADPSSPLAEHALYSLVSAQHNAKELETTTQYIASLKTDSPYVSTILGECYLQLGKIDQAAASFDKAIANHPTTQEPFINRARIYMSAKKTDDAIALLKKAADLMPTDMRASLVQADILRELGQYPESITLYEGILKTSPTTDEAANNMASIIADHEYTDPAMLDKALQAATRFAESPNPLLLDTLGWVYYRQGNLEQASRIFAQATEEKDKITPEIHYHYGVVLAKMGKPAQAKTELTLAVAEGAHYSALEDAKQALAEIQKNQ